MTRGRSSGPPRRRSGSRRWRTAITPAGYYYAANDFFSSEHGGTHVDAPIHFAQGRQTVDQIPLERLIGAGRRRST